VDTVVFPPAPYLIAVGAILRDRRSLVALGAQDVWPKPDGAFTGEVSTTMLTDCGVSTVLAGHSERRHVIGEGDELINAKVRAILAAGMTCVLCVGETLDQREAAQTDVVNERQLRAGLAGVREEATDRLVIAYEPVWAIGTGMTATPQDAQDAHGKIRSVLADLFGPLSGTVVAINDALERLDDSDDAARRLAGLRSPCHSEVAPHRAETRVGVFELRDLDLQLRSVRRRAAREDIEDEFRAVEHFPLDRLFDARDLPGREFVIEHHNPRVERLAQIPEFDELPGAHIRPGFWPLAGLREFAHDGRAGSLRERAEFTKGVTRIEFRFRQVDRCEHGAFLADFDGLSFFGLWQSDDPILQRCPSIRSATTPGISRIIYWQKTANRTHRVGAGRGRRSRRSEGMLVYWIIDLGGQRRKTRTSGL